MILTFTDKIKCHQREDLLESCMSRSQLYCLLPGRVKHSHFQFHAELTRQKCMTLGLFLERNVRDVKQFLYVLPMFGLARPNALRVLSKVQNVDARNAIVTRLSLV